MKMYVIITNIYDALGGLFKNHAKPIKNPYFITFHRDEREMFIEKWKKIIEESDTYFDLPKTYYINFNKVEIIEITDKLTEIENSI